MWTTPEEDDTYSRFVSIRLPICCAVSGLPGIYSQETKRGAHRPKSTSLKGTGSYLNPKAQDFKKAENTTPQKRPAASAMQRENKRGS